MLHSKKPVQWEAWALQLQSSQPALTAAGDKPGVAVETQRSQQTNQSATLKNKRSCEFKFYSGSLLRTFAWETVSRQLWGTSSAEMGEKPVYVWYLTGECMCHAYISVKDYCSHKEQISQVNDFNAFLCMKRFKNFDSLKFLLRYTSNYLWRLFLHWLVFHSVFHPDPSQGAAGHNFILIELGGERHCSLFTWVLWLR